MQATDAQRLTDEYRRLVDGFQGQGIIPRNNEGWLANPALPDDILREAVRCALIVGAAQGPDMHTSSHLHCSLAVSRLSMAKNLMRKRAV
jgi:hypothetical protein